MNIEQIAKVAHEINRAYCKSIGDNSQLSWDDAPQWQRDSAIGGVKAYLNNPDMKPSESHESWLKLKREEGWKYAPIKNADKKEHPCFLPYDELPSYQKSKDYIFKQVVQSLFSSI